MQISNKYSERKPNLDALKIWAICLVCYYHAEVSYKPLNFSNDIASLSLYLMHSLAAIAVPLFFMVNGALMLHRETSFIDGIKRAAKIYFFAMAWIITANYIVGSYKGEEVWSLSYFRESLHILPGKSNRFWFLKSLALIYVFKPFLAPSMIFGSRKSTYATILVLLIAGFAAPTLQQLEKIHLVDVNSGILSAHHTLINKLNGLSVYFFPTAFFVLGGVISRNNNMPIFSKSAAFFLLLIGVAGNFMFGIAESRGKMQFTDIVFPCYQTLPVLLASVGAFVMAQKFIKSDGLYGARGMQFIGKNTLGIYLLHGFVILVMRDIAAPDDGNLERFIKTVLIASTSIGVSLIATKYLASNRITNKAVTI